MPIIDADCHVIENERTWSYVDESERHLRPLLVIPKNEEERGPAYWLVDGRYLQQHQDNLYGIPDAEEPGGRGAVSHTAREAREVTNLATRLAHMDELGVDVQMLYPSYFIHVMTNKDDIDLATCRSYNRWMAEVWKGSNNRLRWAVIPPLLTMDKALEEIHFGKENGACGVYMRTVERDRLLSDPYFFPIYEEASKLDMPITVHDGEGNLGMRDLFIRASGFLKFKMAMAGCVHDLLIKRIPDKFPDLRWGFMEASASWVPWMLNDLDNRLAKVGDHVSADMLKENRFYVECLTRDDLDYVLNFSGEDNLVLGSDYGHADTAAEIDAIRRLQRASVIPSRVVDKILDDNPTALYGL